MPQSGQWLIGRGRLILLGIAVVVVLGGVALAGTLARSAAVSRLTEEAMAAASARVQVLESTLAQQRAVVAILADDDAVRIALRRGGLTGHEDVSLKLDRLRTETRGAVIYLLDRTGTAIAASNWDEPASFVGSSYAFRSYFTDALRDGTAVQFALGTVSHRPGLYLSHVVTDEGHALGVVVVKIEFDMLEASWATGPDETWVTDAAGAVVISSHPDGRFAPMPTISASQIAVSLPAAVPGWQLTHAVPASPVTQAVLSASALAGALLFMAAFGFDRLLRARLKVQRRMLAEARQRAELEVAVAERTRSLQEEMAERRRAERRLAGMQADLVQANKLATLGQVTAGIAHEVNQPLATIRLLAENALALLPRRGPRDVVDNLSSIVRMSDRIAQITTELRGFARKATGQIRPVSLREVIDASVLLTQSRRRAEGARIILPDIPVDLHVEVEAVRLEQVLVNLIQNAQEALAGHPDPQIMIGLAKGVDWLEISVADNGPGLAPEIAAQLFTPFATSKPGGLGLGLVIAQDIIRDFGGELSADPPVTGQGSTFRIRLPHASQEGAKL